MKKNPRPDYITGEIYQIFKEERPEWSDIMEKANQKFFATFLPKKEDFDLYESWNSGGEVPTHHWIKNKS